MMNALAQLNPVYVPYVYARMVTSTIVIYSLLLFDGIAAQSTTAVTAAPTQPDCNTNNLSPHE
jgi:hypothetical protein